MKNRRGQLIVIYGINNLGKTTQAKKLVKRVWTEGYPAEYLKIPVYNLKPSGEIISNYLRLGNRYRLTPREAQIIYAFNRWQYQNTLKEKLSRGINIVSEDYVGTGLAWGVARGVDLAFLKQINAGLLKEDLAFLFDGQRFIEATEAGHGHEDSPALLRRARAAHLKLGAQFGWKKINANQPKEKIHEQIWQTILKAKIIG